MAVTDQLVRGPDQGQPVPKGSVIFCPGCGSGLYEVLKPLRFATIRSSHSCLEPLTEHSVGERDAPFICPECNRLIVGPLGRFWFRPPRRHFVNA